MQNRKELITHWMRGILLAGVFLINATLNAYALDKITLSQGDYGENGAIVDGYISTTFCNDYLPVPTSGPVIELAIGDLSSGYGPGKVIAFTNNRPPTIHPPPNQNTPIWHAGSDNVSIIFQPKYKIPVTVWIVYGLFMTESARAGMFRDNTNTIWRDERQGIELDTAPSQFTINNATSSLQYYSDFNCSKADALKNSPFFNGNQINIYFVNTVSLTAASAGPPGSAQPLTTNAVYCGDVIAIGSEAATHLLAHELGHAFSLDHVRGLPSFSSTNVMHEASNLRLHLTEGQTFRAVVNTFSKINNLYQKRPGLETQYDCALQTDWNQYKDDLHRWRCPLLQTRVWPDDVPITNVGTCAASDIVSPTAPAGLKVQ